MQRQVQEQLAIALAEAAARGLDIPAVADPSSAWPSTVYEYRNRETGHNYQPHHDEELRAILDDNPRYVYFKGGEGSGKSVAGIIKTLERLKRKCTGIMGSPDFAHFKRSLWREFQNWCPPEILVPRCHRMLNIEWTPSEPFALVCVNGAILLCGGFDDPLSWEGPNVNFALFDEPRRHNKPTMLKVLDGRCRIPGPNKVPPQIILASTPRTSAPVNYEGDHHWLYEYFGPWTSDEPDPLKDFKEDTHVVTMLVKDNLPHLDAEYVSKRAQSLTESEKRVYLEAEWEDTDIAAPFLPNMVFWDLCQEDLPPLRPSPKKVIEELEGRGTPRTEIDYRKLRKEIDLVVVALDAATGAKDTASDCFSIAAVTRHPTMKDGIALRYCNAWRAKKGEKIQFRTDDPLEPGPEDVLRWLCATYVVVMVTYDPYQLAYLAERLTVEGIAFMVEFPQSARRAAADKLLQDLIITRKFAHNGDVLARQHAKNADRKVDESGSKVRIVKGRGPVDVLVATSMAAYECLELNL